MKKNKSVTNIANKLAEKSFFIDGSIDLKKTKLYLSLLKRLSRPLAISAIMTYLNRIKNIENKHVLVVESAIELSSVQINEIKSVVSHSYQIINTHVKINPAVLGGVKIKIGDMVYDYTIAERLLQLKGVINE